MIFGEKALRNYKSVKYFPFGNEAGSAYILTSNPLSYLEAYLVSELNSIKRDSHKKKRKDLKKAIYFNNLAKDFYNSSFMAKMPSKGTLLYYSIINLIKVFLIKKGYNLETTHEHHGLTLPSNNKVILNLTRNNNDVISIFHEFAKALGREVNNSDSREVKFQDLLRDLPEIHEICYALKLFPNTKRKFLPVNINIRTNSNYKKIFYTISYEKKFDKLMNTKRLGKGVFKRLLEKQEVKNDNAMHHFKSKLVVNYTHSSDRSWRMCYPRLVENIEELGVSMILTRNGYRYYLDLEGSRFHRLSSILGFAFYLGTVARYRPTLNEDILKGKYQPAINEAIVSCPNQFFYLLVSYITQQPCVIPMANIN